MRHLQDGRGSILVVTLFVTSSLCILLFTATGVVLLAFRSQVAFERSAELFYVAEAGVARAQSWCSLHGVPASSGDGEDGGGPDAGSPWGRWTSFGDGAYLVEIYTADDPHPEVSLPAADDRVLLEVQGRMPPHLRTRIFVLLEAPEACRTVAWWQERDM